MKYLKWEEMEWDGNPFLKLRCYRRHFGNGHVSVGIGDYYTITYSYGDNNENSLSGTRWRKDGKHQTEEEAMQMVDKNNGKYVPQKTDAVPEEESEDCIGEITEDGTIIMGATANGSCYANYRAFNDKTDEICYIPEHCEAEKVGKGVGYKYSDIIRIVEHGLIRNKLLHLPAQGIAEMLMEILDGQSPEILLEEIIEVELKNQEREKDMANMNLLKKYRELADRFMDVGNTLSALQTEHLCLLEAQGKLLKESIEYQKRTLETMKKMDQVEEENKQLRAEVEDLKKRDSLVYQMQAVIRKYRGGGNGEGKL